MSALGHRFRLRVWWRGKVGDFDNWLHIHDHGESLFGRVVCNYYDYLITGSWHPEKD